MTEISLSTNAFHCWNIFLLTSSALITASATLHPLSLSQCSLRRTERRWRYLDGSQNGGKHRAGLLPEKALRRGRAVRTRQEKVVHGCQARTLSRVIEPSQLVIAQGEIPVAPFHIGAGALKHFCELSRLGLQLTLLSQAQVTQYPAGRKQWSPEALG